MRRVGSILLGKRGAIARSPNITRGRMVPQEKVQKVKPKNDSESYKKPGLTGPWSVVRARETSHQQFLDRNSAVLESIHPAHAELIRENVVKGGLFQVDALLSKRILHDLIMDFASKCELLFHSSEGSSLDGDEIAQRRVSSLKRQLREAGVRFGSEERRLLAGFNFRTMLFPDTSIQGIIDDALTKGSEGAVSATQKAIVEEGSRGGRQGSAKQSYPHLRATVMYFRHHKAIPATLSKFSAVNTDAIVSRLVKEKKTRREKATAARAASMALNGSSNGHPSDLIMKVLHGKDHGDSHEAVRGAAKRGARAHRPFSGRQYNAFGKLVKSPTVKRAISAAVETKGNDLRKELEAEARIRRKLQLAFFTQSAVLALNGGHANFLLQERLRCACEGLLPANNIVHHGQHHHNGSNGHRHHHVNGNGHHHHHHHRENGNGAAVADLGDRWQSTQLDADTLANFKFSLLPRATFSGFSAAKFYQRYLQERHFRQEMKHLIDGESWDALKASREALRRAEAQYPPSEARESFGELTRVQRAAFYFIIPCNFERLATPLSGFKAFYTQERIANGSLSTDGERPPKGSRAHVRPIGPIPEAFFTRPKVALLRFLQAETNRLRHDARRRWNEMSAEEQNSFDEPDFSVVAQFPLQRAPTEAGSVASFVMH